MKTINILALFIIFLIILQACKKESSNNVASYISLSTGISITDYNGNDLLESENSFIKDENNIKLFHEVDGKFIEYNAGGLADYPNGISILEPGTFAEGINKYVIKVSLLPYKNWQPYQRCIIKWNDIDIDTIKSEANIQKDNGYCNVIKVWYNDSLVWNYNNPKTNGLRWFQIVK